MSTDQAAKLVNDVMIIKWGVVCIAVSLWGVTAHLLLKEAVKWWHSYDKKNILDKLPKGTYEGGHY